MAQWGHPALLENQWHTEGTVRGTEQCTQIARRGGQEVILGEGVGGWGLTHSPTNYRTTGHVSHHRCQIQGSTQSPLDNCTTESHVRNTSCKKISTVMSRFKTPPLCACTFTAHGRAVAPSCVGVGMQHRGLVVQRDPARKARKNSLPNQFRGGGLGWFKRAGLPPPFHVLS